MDESWTVKKAECWGNDAFELWCWRRLLKNPLDCKEIQPVHHKGNRSWMFIGRTDAEAETPILWPPGEKNSLEKTLVVERLKVGGEGDDRGWDGWMASLTQWTWVWANSGSWWWTGRPGMLQSMGSQRVRQDWETELTDLLSLNSSHTFSFSYFPYSVSERLCKWPGTKLALTAPCSFHCFKTVSQLLGFNLVSPYLLRPHKFFDI